jgi:prepilin-type N-terminal cleavage/methylation domain-containing protein
LTNITKLRNIKSKNDSAVESRNIKNYKPKGVLQMKNLKIRARRGFTLIELVVVIAILGILAGLAIPRFLDATATARGARIVADMRTIDSAIVIYNAKTGNMPTGEASLTTSSGTTSYQLLAAWPVPPTGKAIITTNTGAQKNYTPTATAYELDTTNGRATLDSKTVDELLKD